MLVGGSLFARRRVTFLLTLVVLFLLPAGIYYGMARAGEIDWPSGTSDIGFYCGLGAGAIVIFEMLLWLRKKLRRVRFFGAARYWMWLHIWLGLLAIPLAIVHSGFGFGGPLSAWTMAFFLIVSASGIWGLAMQQIVPTRLLSEITEESIASQADAVMKSYLLEAEQLVGALTEPLPVGEEERIGGVATAKRIKPLAMGSVSVSLKKFFDTEIAPYLKDGKASRSVLKSKAQAYRLFAQLIDQLPVHALDHARKLEKMCDTRRQLDRQRTYDAWLHCWLLIHFPLSVALTVLLVWHVVVALKFW